MSSCIYICYHILLQYHIFGGFPQFFLLLISNLIPLWSKKIRNSNSSVFVEPCFMVCDVFYLDGCSLCTGKEGLFCCCWLNIFSVETRSGWLITVVQVLSVLTSPLSICSASQGVLKSLTVIMHLSISPCGKTGFCFSRVLKELFILCIYV